MLDLHKPLYMGQRICIGLGSTENDIFESYVHLFRGGVESQFLLIDDNVSPYRTHLVNNFLAGKNILQMKKPPKSHDFNSIEDMWNTLQRKSCNYCRI